MFREDERASLNNLLKNEDMIKHYKSNTSIAINVVLKSKKNMHVAFTAQSDGSSVFSTDNPDVQYAIEHHYKYGKLFKLTGVEDEEEQKAKKEAEKAAKKKEEMRKVSVSDLAAAKDFLSDTFGISRTSLRTSDAIISTAKSHNIVFEGI